MNDNNADYPPQAPEPESYEAPPQGPPVGLPQEPFLSRLRRSKSDEMVGGVSGGLGVATGIDPLIFRVAFVAATFAGGAGVILYLAAWMFIPEEGSSVGGIGKEFKVKDDVQVRTIGMIAAGVIAAMAALGSGPWFFGSWSNGSMWAIVTIGLTAGLLYWIISASKAQPKDSQPPGATPPSSAGSATNTGSAWTASGSAQPHQTAPKAPREPGGLVLFGLTLSLGAIGLGALALWASATEPLDPKVYLVAALGVTALGTLIGVRWGRPGPLITLGTILSAILVLSSFVPTFSMGAFDLEPTSVREIQEPVSLGMGEIKIDLRDVSPATSLNGHTLNVSNGVGRVEVIVPEGLDVEVNASVRIGQINALGLEGAGNTFQLGRSNNLVHEAEGPNPLVINATTNIGEVQVIRK